VVVGNSGQELSVVFFEPSSETLEDGSCVLVEVFVSSWYACCSSISELSRR
jgi:hypothetical protein